MAVRLRRGDAAPADALETSIHENHADIHHAHARRSHLRAPRIDLRVVRREGGAPTRARQGPDAAVHHRPAGDLRLRPRGDNVLADRVGSPADRHRARRARERRARAGRGERRGRRTRPRETDALRRRRPREDVLGRAVAGQRRRVRPDAGVLRPPRLGGYRARTRDAAAVDGASRGAERAKRSKRERGRDRRPRRAASAPGAVLRVRRRRAGPAGADGRGEGHRARVAPRPAVQKIEKRRAGDNRGWRHDPPGGRPRSDAPGAPPLPPRGHVRQRRDRRARARRGRSRAREHVRGV
mmetsp:Transcript_13399/g.48053  ORF Transcript_13399/g.48053 Transcript_13399/m.48053 type:complete len:297 (-) Transcript_13399:611-1501(-)